MKTKFDKILLIIATIVLAFNYSCTDLEEEVYDQLAGDKVFNSEEDVLPIIGKGYANLRNILDWHGWYMNQIYCTDEIIQPTRGWAWYDGGVFQAMHLHTFDAETGVNCFYYFQDNITNANLIIDMLENAEFEIDGIEMTIAEMKMVRAFNYYLMMDNFGNVPFVVGFSELPEGYLPEQKSRSEVYQWLVDEITENLPLLSDEAPRNEYWGRFTKWGALAMLADIQLNAEVYSGTGHWDDCIAACDQIISSGLFSLEDDYSAPFKKENENSSEAVFAIPFDADYANWMPFWQLSMHYSSKFTYGAENGCWNGYCAVPSFFDSYDPDDLRRDKTWASGPQYTQSGELITMGDGNVLDFNNDVTSIFNTGENNGVRFAKYEYYEGMRNMSNDMPFYRYSKILMMKAECLLRKGNEPAAAEIINTVRERAFDPNKPVEASELTLDRMLAEWGWETGGEGTRRQDQIRFGTFTTKSWDPDHTPNGDHRIVFALPQSALDANPNLVQNPGY